LYVIASFEHSIELEMALVSLEKQGIPKGNILAVPLDKRAEANTLFDTIHQSDGISLFDIAAVLGSVCMVLGAIYGYVLYWGPIIWGLIGLAIGSSIGFAIKYFMHRRKRNPNRQNLDKGGRLRTEVIVMIRCQSDQVELIKKILWHHRVHGVANLRLQQEQQA